MNEIKILGLSGKKQSGKNTAANYVVGLFIKSLKITEDFHITDKGKLFVTDIFGNKDFAGILDLESKNPEFVEFAEEYIYPFVKIYSYADILKQKICIDTLGLTWEQCYGTDEQKNELTHLKWEDMPNVTTIETPQSEIDVEIAGRLGAYYEKCFNGLTYHKPGIMTAREVMQFTGTEIFRKMYNNVWVDATLRQIEKDQPTFAIISDIRFVNEVKAITNLEHGRIIRFTRNIYKDKDQHESETALDNYKWKPEQILANKKLSIADQNEIFHQMLEDMQWLPRSVPEELFGGITL